MHISCQSTFYTFSAILNAIDDSSLWTRKNHIIPNGKNRRMIVSVMHISCQSDLFPNFLFFFYKNNLPIFDYRNFLKHWNFNKFFVSYLYIWLKWYNIIYMIRTSLKSTSDLSIRMISFLKFNIFLVYKE